MSLELLDSMLSGKTPPGTLPGIRVNNLPDGTYVLQLSSVDLFESNAGNTSLHFTWLVLRNLQIPTFNKVGEVYQDFQVLINENNANALYQRLFDLLGKHCPVKEAIEILNSRHAIIQARLQTNGPYQNVWLTQVLHRQHDLLTPEQARIAARVAQENDKQNLAVPKSKCATCGKSFATSRGLLAHQRKAHKAPSTKVVTAPDTEFEADDTTPFE